MKIEFSDKKTLAKIVEAIENYYCRGALIVDEASTTEPIPEELKNFPEPVKLFFRDNGIRMCHLMNSLPSPFFIKDSKANWFYVNEQFCKFFNMDPKEIYGKNSFFLFPENKAEQLYQQDLDLLKTGHDSQIEIVIYDTDGFTRTILSKKTLFHDINKQPYIVGLFHEITGLKDIETSIKQENTELETMVKGRTTLLTATIEKMQEEINQRKKTEQALIQEEDKFRNVIEQATEGISINDIHGKIIEWNNALVEITGITKAEALGKYHWDIEFEMMTADKKSKEFYEKLKQNTLATFQNETFPEKFKKLEGKIVRRDGEERYVDYSIFLIKTQNASYVSRVVRDITGQKKFMQALQRSEAQYRTLFENSSVAILIINPENNKILAANQKASETYGYSIAELTGMQMEQITKDIGLESQQIEKIKNHQASKDFSTIHLNRKGEEIHMLVDGSTVEYGGIPAIMNFNRDITEIKRLEKARETVYKISQLAHTVDNMNDMYKSIHKIINEILPARNFYIALYDDVTDIVSFPYFVDEKDSSPSPHRLKRGLTEYVLRHGEPVLTTAELLKQLELSGEIEILGAYSETWMGVPLITHNKVIGVVAVQSYSPEIQFTMNEKDLLVYASEQIAQQIYKRQAEEEILRGKAKAEESDRLKTSLITNMNHDLRTPMTGILGFASLLKNRIKDAETLSMVDTIIESGNKLMSIINSILQLSQLEAGQKQISLISGEVTKYVEMPLAQLEIKARQKNLSIVRQFEHDIVAVFNESYLIQAITNIVNNAISYTEKGSITIKTGLTEHQGKKFAYIKIRDTGIGIDANNFSRIFQEFRQVSEGLNRRYDGSGLGLSISKKMIEMMGGQILVESQLGKGSVFTILLPLASEKMKKKEIPAKEKENQKIARLPKTHNLPKVLVVEDNKINGELIYAYLKQDYEVDIAKTGFLAIELVKRSEYNIVLMDINLGDGMNGMQVAREIHKIYKNLPIVALTGYSTEKEIAAILKHDFIGYILKPVDRVSLYNVLEKTIPKK
ncbi:MAG TPA: PAS domain S-box protein [Bacteroidales bacterium]|nr:PAS domain S-box protein [Bacteroidales bacterium]